MARVNRIDTQVAELLAIQALGYLASEPEQRGRFLALTGLGPESIRTAAHDPRFLAGVLDHVAGDEALLTAFADHAQVKPARVMEARAALGSRDWERETP